MIGESLSKFYRSFAEKASREERNACIEIAELFEEIQFSDFKQMLEYLEFPRLIPNTLASRIAERSDATEADLAILDADLDLVPVGSLRSVCRALNLDSKGAAGPLRKRIRESSDLKKVGAELNVKNTEGHLYPAWLFSVSWDFYESQLGASQKKLLSRLYSSIVYGAINGGLNEYIRKNSVQLENTFVGIAKTLSNHSRNSGLSTDVIGILQSQSVGNLRGLCDLLGLDSKGTKTDINKRIIAHFGSPLIEDDLINEGKPSEKNVEAAVDLFDTIQRRASEGVPEGELRKDYIQFEALSDDVILEVGRRFRYKHKRAKETKESLWGAIRRASDLAARN